MQQRGQFFGRQELVPIMCAARDLAQTFCRLDQKQARRRRAVGGRQQEQAVGLQMACQFGDEGGGVGDMFDHLHRGDDIECGQALCRNFAGAIVDAKAG